MMGNLSVKLSVMGVWALAMMLLSSINCYTSASEAITISRKDFPDNFIFGAGSAAFQVEGAAFKGGRGMSIWDAFSHTPGKIIDNSTADVSVDQYDRYEKDLRLLKEMGMDAYRFSISWPRIFPNGAPRNGEINADGVDHYNRIINATKTIGLEPYVTLFHWDLPLALEYEYGGFRNARIVQDFHAYANACFSLFGDRVKHWITLNEPWTFSVYGYDLGYHAPGRCSPFFNTTNNARCMAGDSGVEPYRVAHNMLLAHAKVSELYKREFKPTQNGAIGITLLTQWFVPFNLSNSNDTEAAERMVDFFIGWFLQPLVNGTYPISMTNYVNNRLPNFTSEERRALRNSLDFLGINYYTSQFAAFMPNISDPEHLRYTTDALVLPTFRNASGDPIGRPSGLHWLAVYPEGIYRVLAYATGLSGIWSGKFIPIYITENGYPKENNSTSPIPSEYTYDCSLEKEMFPLLEDPERVDYHEDHLSYVLKAMSNGSNVMGYFGWSLTDSFEWNGGFTARFGLHYVDYLGNLTRYVKRSACWFRSFNGIVQAWDIKSAGQNNIEI